MTYFNGPAPSAARTAGLPAKIAGAVEIYGLMTTVLRRCLVSDRFGVFYFYLEQQKESHAL